eukprot:6197269-Pleurochrysis_carterae.AAC.3
MKGLQKLTTHCPSASPMPESGLVAGAAVSFKYLDNLLQKPYLLGRAKLEGAQFVYRCNQDIRETMYLFFALRRLFDALTCMSPTGNSYSQHCLGLGPPCANIRSFPEPDATCVAE